MRTTLSAPIDVTGMVARRTKGAGLEAPNPTSGGLVAETPNLSMSFANEIYRRSGGAQGIAPSAEQLAYQHAGGAQLSNYQWNSVKAGKYTTDATEELLWHQTGGRLGLPGNPELRQTASVSTDQTAGPDTPAAVTATADPAPVAAKTAVPALAADTHVDQLNAASAGQSASARWFDAVLRITKA